MNILFRLITALDSLFTSMAVKETRKRTDRLVFVAVELRKEKLFTRKV